MYYCSSKYLNFHITVISVIFLCFYQSFNLISDIIFLLLAINWY